MCLRRLPRNPNRLIDLKQSVTLTGLGSESFDKAVRGLCMLYQNVKGQVMQRGCQLREWAPGEDGGNLTLTFSNRYLTAAKDVADDDVRQDLGEVVDPFNILRPLLRTEVHTSDNCVEYWERQRGAQSPSVHGRLISCSSLTQFSAGMRSSVLNQNCST